MGEGGGGLVSPERVPTYLAAFTAVLWLVLGVEIANQLLRLGPLSAVTVADVPWPYVLSFLISLPFLAWLVYGTRYLRRDPFSSARYPRIAYWSFGGAAGWLVINLLTLASFGVTATWGVIGWTRGALVFGGAFGLAIGVAEARAVSRAIAAEQARLRTEHVREQRDLIDYVNSLIRHEVLNSANVIQGRAELLAADLPESDPRRDHVDPIVRRSEEIENVVTEVRTIMETVHQKPSLEPRRLHEIVSREAAKVRDVNPEATVEVDVPTDVRVRTDDTLGLVFGNLLANAVEHAAGDAPHISVSVGADDATTGDAGGTDGTSETDDGRVTVTVSDDGPGIDPEVRDTLFDRPSGGTGDHGYGLYLVSYLCDRLDGDIELAETGPDGTTFTLTLPAAESADDDAFASTETASPAA